MAVDRPGEGGEAALRVLGVASVRQLRPACTCCDPIDSRKDRLHARLYPDFTDIRAGGFTVPQSCLDKDMIKQKGSERYTTEQRTVGSMSSMGA